MKNLSRREFLRQAVMVGLGVAGANALASCAPPAAGVPMAATPEPITSEPTAGIEPVEITYWQAPIWRYGADNKTIVGAGSDDWINGAIARFEAKNPDIKVKMEMIPWDQWGQKVATGFATGDLPNVMYGQLSVDRVQAGLFDPLDDYLTPGMLDNWLPGLKNAVTIFNRIYGIPAIVNPHMSALSKTALEQHGGAEVLDAIGEDRSNLTFDMMKEYGEQFGDGSSRYFFGVPADHGSVVYWMFGTWLEGWGVQSWSDDEERWIVNDQPNAAKAFQWLVDAQDEWQVLIPQLPKWSDVDNLYWNLNCAMRYQWAGIQTELEVAQEAGQAPEDFEIVLAGPPRLEEVDPFVAGSSAPVPYTVCRTPNPDKREKAFRWANWLATDDSNAEGWLVNGYFPSTKSGGVAVKDHPFMEDPNRRWVLETYLPKYAPETKGGNWTPTTNARTSKIFNQINPWDYYIQQFQSLLLGQKTAEQMLQEMAERINGALGVEI